MSKKSSKFATEIESRRNMEETPSDILQEITPLGEYDFMYVADRRKERFDYPLHRHALFELNFIENARGAERIVGDSVETIGDYELVLISSSNLEHAWSQGECTSTNIHEITVQFALDFQNVGIFHTNAFRSITQLLTRAQQGLAFPMPAIMSVYPRLSRLSQIKEGFYAVVELFNILYELSKCDEARELSSSSYAQVRPDSESRRVKTVKEYITTHYMEEIRLEQMSSLVNMSPTAFSRYFKQRTGKSMADYIVDIRIGVAARKLIDTVEPVSGICFDCGFNTLSNFNRLFRLKKHCSPTEFREKYAKTKVIV
jgi:AraC-like DNA-binding protein